MNTADQCENLFSNVDDLGAGIAAIGDLMQHVGKAAEHDTSYGIGLILRRFGLEMRGMNNQFVEKTYKNIRGLEIKEAQAAERAAQPEIAAKEEMRSTLLKTELSRILEHAIAVNEPLPQKPAASSR